MEEMKRGNSSDMEKNDDKYRMYASLAFMIVVIVIGVPMWWKTTEVYRVPLPYAEMQNILNKPLRVSLKIGIFTFDSKFTDTLLSELRNHYKDSDIWKIQFIHINHVEHARDMKSPAALESRILKIFKMNQGDFLIYEWPVLRQDVLLTSDRSALITNTTALEKMYQLIDLYVLQTYKVRTIIDENKFGSKNYLPQLQYRVLLSVINPSPDKLNIMWNIALASEVYLSPFFESINQISNFVIKSQWRYQVPFDFSLEKVKDNSTLGHYYVVSKDVLPHIITSVEKNLGQSINDNFQINIVIYVPPCEIAPLYIDKGTTGQVNPKNNIDSFFSPKWGSVLILNPPEEVCLMKTTEKISFNINSKDVMPIILFHQQKLLDIRTDIFIDGIELVTNDQLVPRTWEYDAYIRRNVINHIVTANRTLQSLIQLLDNISYIVINDDVGKAISNAYENILKTKKHLEAGQLFEASNFSKEAFISSEKAFFDASLLEQLYFPDEQKYAVYIPLFLPIMVPVITSIASLKKHFVKNKIKED